MELTRVYLHLNCLLVKTWLRSLLGSVATRSHFPGLCPCSAERNAIPNRKFLPVQGTKAIRLVLNRFETGERRPGSIRVTALSNNGLADLSISGVSTRRVALTERDAFS